MAAAAILDFWNRKFLFAAAAILDCCKWFEIINNDLAMIV